MTRSGPPEQCRARARIKKQEGNSMSKEIEVKDTSEQPDKPKKSGVRKTLSIIGNILLWIFVAFCVLITVLAFAQSSSSYNVPSLGGKMILNVQTDSMADTFFAGDIIISTKLDETEAEELQVDDVITYSVGDLNGDNYKDLNTHRIVEIVKDENGAVLGYHTKGDNEKTNTAMDDFDGDNEVDLINPGAVVGKWTGTRIPKVGKFLSFLQTSTGFLVVIVIPLVLFFLFELIVFIRKFLAIKNEGKKTISSADEELIRQRAIEEYIRKQQEAAAQQAAAQANAQAEPEAPPQDAQEPGDDGTKEDPMQ